MPHLSGVVAAELGKHVEQLFKLRFWLENECIFVACRSGGLRDALLLFDSVPWCLDVSSGVGRRLGLVMSDRLCRQHFCTASHDDTLRGGEDAGEHLKRLLWTRVRGSETIIIISKYKIAVCATSQVAPLFINEI